MSRSQNERVKASKLRRRMKAGKTLSPEQRQFLDAYEKSSTRATIAAAKSRNTPAVGESRDSRNTPAVVRGPQLQIGGTSAPSGSHVHRTIQHSDKVDPQSTLWTPTVPASSSTEPPPPGAPPPPTEGAPIVNGVQPELDPRAGEQLATIVGIIAAVGLASAIELLNGTEVPAPLIPFIQQAMDPEVTKKGLEQLTEACKRLAVKYQLKGVPMVDELMVGGVVLLSGAAAVAAHKRRKLKPGEKRPPLARRAEQPRAEQPRAEQPAPPPPVENADVPVEGLWGKS